MSKEFLPDAAFMYYVNSKKASAIANKILDKLDWRTAQMEYSKDYFAFGYNVPSIVEAILGGNGRLGSEVAEYLEQAMPNGFHKRRATIYDVINPMNVDSELAVYLNGTYHWFFTSHGIFDQYKQPTAKDHKALFYDDRFLIIIYNHGKSPLNIYVFRIPKE